MNAQEVNFLPETLPETTQFFPKVYITLHPTTSQCLSSYCCVMNYSTLSWATCFFFHDAREHEVPEGE